MENTKQCKRGAHRFPEVVFTYQPQGQSVQKTIAARDASMIGALFLTKPPEDFNNAQSYQFELNGLKFNAKEFTLDNKEGRYIAKYQGLHTATPVLTGIEQIEKNVELKLRGEFEAREVRNAEKAKAEIDKMLKDDSIAAIRGEIKEKQKEVLKSLSEGGPAIPQNKMKFGLLLLGGLLGFVLIILPVSQKLFSGIEANDFHKSMLTWGIVCLCLLMGLLAVNVFFKKLSDRFVLLEAMLGLVSFALLIPPLMLNLFAAKVPTTTISATIATITMDNVPFVAMIGAGVLLLIAIAAMIWKMQKGLDEYVRNDTRVAYLNYLNQTLLALSMAELSGDSLKKAIDEIHKAGDQLINCTYR
jgi:hypothetical protein